MRERNGIKWKILAWKRRASATIITTHSAFSIGMEKKEEQEQEEQQQNEEKYDEKMNKRVVFS